MISTKKNILININVIEWILIIGVIIFSFINTITLFISFILLLVLLKQKEIGAIKILNIITLRTMINSGLAVNIGTLQEIKWIILLGCSIYLISSYTKLNSKEKNKIDPIILMVIIFFIYNVIISFLLGSLPTISIFKLISYVIVFLGILIGIAYTSKKIEWINWMYTLLFILIVPSIFTLNLPIGYITNTISFQGLTNQPNAFGTISVLFIALLLTKRRLYYNYNKYIFSSLIILSVYMVILSKSRTALISFALLILLYIITKKIKKLTDITIFAFTTIFVFIILLNTKVISYVSELLYKGQKEGELLKSRENQLGELTTNFYENPWLGNGFLTPVLPERSFKFSFDFVVEPGNILLAVLSYSGIIGFIIFFLFIILILMSNKKMILSIFFLPLSIFLINMAEMSFFSSNNTGIWAYMFLSLYIFTETKNENYLHKYK